MAVRRRSRYTQNHVGTYKYGSSFENFYYNDLDQITEDTVPSWDGGYFRSIKVERKGGTFSGTNSFGEVWTNVPINGRTLFPLIDLPGGRPPDAQLATKLLALTNPSKPSINLPSVIGEFIADGIPLIKFKGGTILQKLGGAYLTGAFGIRPIASDLATSLQFVQLVDKRMRTLNNLKKNGKLSYTIDLFSNSKSQLIKDFPMGTFFNFLWGDMAEHSSVRTSGHVKWFPTETFPVADQEQLALAIRCVLGLYQSPHSFWEILPWSWLIDYFSNVGDILSSMRNECNLTHSIPQIMDRTEQVSTGTRFSNPGNMGVIPLNTTLSTKNRVSVSGSLSASIPILTDGQWSILGALALKYFG